MLTSVTQKKRKKEVKKGKAVIIKARTKEFTGKKNKHPLWELLWATQQRIIAHKLRLHKQCNKILGLIYGGETSCTVPPWTAVSAQKSNHVVISEKQLSIPPKRGQ